MDPKSPHCTAHEEDDKGPRRIRLLRFRVCIHRDIRNHGGRVLGVSFVKGLRLRAVTMGTSAVEAVSASPK